MYMSSQCTNDGTYTLTVTFKPGTDLNMAQMLVQNRVNLALPILPDLVQTPRRHGQEEIAQRADDGQSALAQRHSRQPDVSEQLRDHPIARRTGATARASATSAIMGQRDYSMRVWLDPGKMATLDVTSSDVSKAITEQNVEVAAGQVGQPPVPKGQVFQFIDQYAGAAQANPKNSPKSSSSPTAPSGRIVRMKDVGRHRTRRAVVRPDLHARTANRRSPYRSTSCPGATPWRRPDRCERRWRSCKTLPRRMSNTRSSTTPRRSSRESVARSLQDAASTPSSWSRS